MEYSVKRRVVEILCFLRVCKYEIFHRFLRMTLVSYRFYYFKVKKKDIFRLEQGLRSWTLSSRHPLRMESSGIKNRVGVGYWTCSGHSHGKNHSGTESKRWTRTPYYDRRGHLNTPTDDSTTDILQELPFPLSRYLCSSFVVNFGKISTSVKKENFVSWCPS